DPDEDGGTTPFLLALPVIDADAFVAALGESYPRLASPGADPFAFQLPTGRRLFLGFTGAPGATVAVLAFRPGVVRAGAPFLVGLMTSPTNDVVLHVALDKLRVKH